MSRYSVSLRTIPALVLFVLAVAAPMAFGQAPGPCPGCPPHHGPGMGPGPAPGPGPGMGPGPMGLGNWWRNPGLKTELGLTDDQVKKIEDAWYASVEAEVDLRAAAEKAHLELARLLHRETLDDEALAKAIDRVTEADAALARNRLQRRVEIAKILTPEQRRKLEELMRQHRGRHGMKGRKGKHHPRRGRRGAPRKN